MGIESGSPDPDWSTRDIVIDTLVKRFQPEPVITHVELFVPPGSADDHTAFATYVDRKAGWSASFTSSEEFYLGGEHSWRAVPARMGNAAAKARVACDASQGAPYSLLRYVTSVPPLRALSPMLPDTPKSPGHCATISARVLKNSGFSIPRSSAWYSPSTLYMDVAKPLRTQEYYACDIDAARVLSVVEREETERAVETLLRGSNDQVRRMTTDGCKAAVDHLQKLVVEQRAQSHVNPAREAALERDLAKGLLRWGNTQHTSLLGTASGPCEA